MYDSSLKKDEASLMIHQTLNLIGGYIIKVGKRQMNMCQMNHAGDKYE